MFSYIQDEDGIIPSDNKYIAFDKIFIHISQNFSFSLKALLDETSFLNKHI